MRTPTKIAGFAAGLALAFGAAAGIGQAAGPTLDVQESTDHADMSSDTGHAAGGHAEPDASNAGHGGHGDEAGKSADPVMPGGLMVSQDGYTLRLDQTTVAAGSDVPIALSILDADGAAVTEFEVEHAKRLHLIAVRRDATGYQHVHPVMDADGTWRTELDLRPGQWRIFADMAPSDGEPLTLGADLDVAGNYQPVAASGDRPEASIADGYTVSVQGDLVAGDEAELTLTVQRGGRPVTDLSSYLGAYGHLVALREGDLAYLHVHPDGDPADGTTEPGPEVTFYAEVPSAGSYRLFFDFRHNGVVRTAPLALTAETSGPGSGADVDAPDGQNAPDADGDPGEGDGGHSENRHSH